MKPSFLFCFSALGFVSTLHSQEEDPYIWLEEVESDRALAWVHEQNEITFKKLQAYSGYSDIYEKSLAIYNSNERIAQPSLRGEYIYNFWQDKTHVRGIWRRCDQGSYLSGNPKWETLLDLDALSAEEGINWVFAGAEELYPGATRFLVSLSRGGGDASVTREFDPVKKEFIEGGFELPEAKGGACYMDENTIAVSTDFGEGTMTTSGYANEVRIWKRGEKLEDAKLIHQGELTDVISSCYMMHDGDKSYLFITRAITFYTSRFFVYQNDKLIELALPEDAEINGLIQDQLLVSLKSDWNINGKLFKQGALVSMPLSNLLAGKANPVLVFEPDAQTSVAGVSTTKNTVILNTTKNVKSEVYICKYNKTNWSLTKVSAPDFGTISLGSADDYTDRFFFNYQNFVTPATLYMADAATNKITPIKSLPSFFDAGNLVVEQFMATSSDATQVPYYVVRKKDLTYDGNNPTLLYAYGGFEVSYLPTYSGPMGKNWLENGGVYVLANIRGGGEYGPKWHQAGLKENRQRVYDDFHAVAEDLMTKKMTSKGHLGIMGGSNGGLLMGVAFTQRPDLYSAVCCQVPLLDMQRFNKLLAGASWMGEYGNPDIPEEWAYIQKYSPYHNLKKDMEYPEVFFTTSTRDDRVHPGHARKMAAKMIDMGYNVFYYENTEGGHAGSSTNEQRAKSVALQYSYLWMKLK